MIPGCREGYEELETFTIEDVSCQLWRSTPTFDEDWDGFLKSSPLGHFQQSSLWAAFKAGEGWAHHRVVMTADGSIVGGFQILWKRTRLGRIGYALKSWVDGTQNSVQGNILGRSFRSAAAELGLVAMVAQFPDSGTPPAEFLRKLDFLETNPMRIIEATCLANVADGIENVRRRMHRGVRKGLRKAKDRGMRVREGTAADVAPFFELMRSTCKRLRTQPNPASVESLENLWRTFDRSGAIRLTIADVEGVPTAGHLAINFGRRSSLWKKGWNGLNGHLHPNELLEDDAFAWAGSNGYEICDFCAIDREVAEQLLAGKPFPSGPKHSRDAYNLRFGGYPALIPRAQLLVLNPMLRWGYRVFSRCLGR